MVLVQTTIRLTLWLSDPGLAARHRQAPPVERLAAGFAGALGVILTSTASGHRLFHHALIIRHARPILSCWTTMVRQSLQFLRDQHCETVPGLHSWATGAQPNVSKAHLLRKTSSPALILLH